MGFLDKFKKNTELKTQETKIVESEGNGLIDLSNAILMETRTDLTEENTISLPIEELATLGVAVASLIPSLRTVTQTTTIETSGLYRITNMVAGDKIKETKKGIKYAVVTPKEGKTKLAQLAEVGPLSATNSTVMPLDPATIMMAVALHSIEQQIGEILEMEKQILSFLEKDKESEIEADLKTLTTIIKEYKFNWDKEQYIASHHKLALDIKRTAEKNMIFYQKQIPEIMKSKQLLVASKAVNFTEKNLEKNFKYYRLSLYIYSLASFLEVMLLGNFQEDYILQVKGMVEKYSEEYKQMYSMSHGYIDKIANKSVESNVVKGIGTAGEAIGGFIGKIPLVKEGAVDEWLVENGQNLKQTSQNMKDKAGKRFEIIEDAGTENFVMRFDEINRIYNHTKAIYFDSEKIYLAE